MRSHDDGGGLSACEENSYKGKGNGCKGDQEAFFSEGGRVGDPMSDQGFRWDKHRSSMYYSSIPAFLLLLPAERRQPRLWCCASWWMSPRLQAYAKRKGERGKGKGGELEEDCRKVCDYGRCLVLIFSRTGSRREKVGCRVESRQGPGRRVCCGLWVVASSFLTRWREGLVRCCPALCVARRFFFLCFFLP